MADWATHPNFPNVKYTSTQKGDVLMLYFSCNICGDQTPMRCNGVRGWPLYRLNTYANMHRHGRPFIANPRPR